jgi:hypothetical protein
MICMESMAIPLKVLRAAGVSIAIAVGLWVARGVEETTPN